MRARPASPTRVIRMSAGIALEQMQVQASKGNLDPRLLDLMALIAEGCQRMHSLVNDLLNNGEPQIDKAKPKRAFVG